MRAAGMSRQLAASIGRDELAATCRESPCLCAPPYYRGACTYILPPWNRRDIFPARATGSGQRAAPVGGQDAARAHDGDGASVGQGRSGGASGAIVGAGKSGWFPRRRAGKPGVGAHRAFPREYTHKKQRNFAK